MAADWLESIGETPNEGGECSLSAGQNIGGLIIWNS
jgi:hypothetical protein